MTGVSRARDAADGVGNCRDLDIAPRPAAPTTSSTSTRVAARRGFVLDTDPVYDRAGSRLAHGCTMAAVKMWETVG
jgi:hypothetical protein